MKYTENDSSLGDIVKKTNTAFIVEKTREKEATTMFKMILKRRLEKNKKKGFTLIELIVVIVIIAIIAAIAVPALTRYIESANNRAAQANAHNIQVVLQAEVTNFYESQLKTGTLTSGDNLFDTAADSTVTPARAAGVPKGAPNDYPGVTGSTYATPIILYILEYNGVILPSDAVLDKITFEGKRLATFEYTHSPGGVTVVFGPEGFSFS